jgi:hypothetical protein
VLQEDEEVGWGKGEGGGGEGRGEALTLILDCASPSDVLRLIRATEALEDARCQNALGLRLPFWRSKCSCEREASTGNFRGHAGSSRHVMTMSK